MTATAAAGMLDVIGVLAIIGTIGSNWLTDPFDRLLLGAYCVLRGLALAVPVILGPSVRTPLLLLVMFFMGLDWVAPAATLCRVFKGWSGAIVFGWVLPAHMIGDALAPTASGFTREAQVSHSMSWWLATGLAILAGGACLAIPAVMHGREIAFAVD